MMAYTLSITLRRWLLSLHVLFVAVWLGTVMSLLWLSIATLTAPGGTNPGEGLRFLLFLLDRPVRVSALGTAVTGGLLSVLTHWGLVRHWWLIAKQIVTVCSLGLSLVGLSLTVERAFAGNSVDAPTLLVGIATQIVALATVVVISVFKPWGKRIPRPTRGTAPTRSTA